MAVTTAPDPAFRERVRASFAQQSIMATLGVSCERIEAGECDLAFARRDDLLQQHGFVHAGVLATVLDSACGYAAASLMPAETGVLSIEFHTHLLSPAAGERFVARAHVVRAGRSITVVRAEAYAQNAGAEKLVAIMTATMMTVHDGVKG